MDDIDFIVGTFGKAFASYGAFVVCDEMFRDFLVNTQRSLIFTTALPPVNVAWTRLSLTGCRILLLSYETDRSCRTTASDTGKPGIRDPGRFSYRAFPVWE